MVSINLRNLFDFKEAYRQALKENADSFFFEGEEVSTSTAFHMIIYAEKRINSPRIEHWSF